MKFLYASLIGLFISFPCLATTIVVKEGDRENARWEENDGLNQIKTIDARANVLSLTKADSAVAMDYQIESSDEGSVSALSKPASSCLSVDTLARMTAFI